MADRELTDQKSNYLILDHLMRKKRDEKTTELVTQIVNSTLSEDEKVRRILKIDAYTVSANELKKENVLQDKNTRKLLSDQKIITESQAAQNRLKIKTGPSRIPWLFFIFKRQPLLKEFCRKTMAVNYSRFPPSMKLERGVRAFLIYTVQNEAVTLLGIIPAVLKYGWKYLDKHDYNLIVLFRRLLEMIAFTDFLNIPYTGNVSKDFMEIETLFLSCHFKSEYPEIIVNGIDNVCQRVPNLQKKRLRAVELARRTLYPEGDRLSLFHVIRGINMVECRCYVELNDLINHGLDDVIGNFDYQADAEVQDAISQIIKERVVEIDKLNAVLGEVNKIKQFIWDYKNDDSLEGYDYRVIRAFYESEKSNKRDFEHDRKDMAYFASVFYPRFFEEFEALLSKTVKMKDVGAFNVFHKSFFQQEMDKLSGLIAKYNKQIFIVPHMGYAAYKAIRNGEITGNTPDMMTYKYLEQLATILVAIGKKLANVYVYRKPEENPDQTMIIPVENGMIGNRKVVIPYWDAYFVDDGFIGGKKFYEVLRILITMCFLIAIYYQNDKITGILEKGVSTGNEIDKRVAEIKSIANAVQFEELKAKYGWSEPK